MKTLTKWMVTGAFVALAGVVAAPAPAVGVDDLASFYVAEKLQVGTVNLEPGVYLVRAFHTGSSRNVLVVTNAEGTKVFSTLLVTPHQIAAYEVQGASRLLYEAGDAARPAALRTFYPANSPFGHDVVSSRPPAGVASSNLREIPAIATLR